MYEYPCGNGQQLNLDWFLNEWKNLLAAWEAEKNGIEGALQAEIDRAEAALTDIFAARDAAAQSATAAGNSADAAAQSATDASGYLATVRADANAARDAARNTAQSESNAADSAQTAVASKNAAGQSERNAAQSEANANSSKNAAAESASDADASKRAAAQSAADADASKSAAAQSASDAEDAAASVEASAQQITTNASDISNLKESIDNDYVPNWVDGKKINSVLGNIIDDANFSYTKIDVAPSLVIKGLTRALGMYNGIAFYTIDGQFISGVYNNNGTNNWNFELESPQNSAYALISCLTATKSMFYCSYYEITRSVVSATNELMKKPKTYYCGATRELSTLKAGIEEATKLMDSVLYVDAGTYDLIEEFGSSYFENLTSANQFAGLILKNRIHVIFSPNSKVISHYTGNNEFAQKLYSPFNAGQYGFTIENLTLECSRCRYGFHDERNGAAEEYKAHYINCNVLLNNNDNTYWSSQHLVGGGLGTNAEIIIENCVWASGQPSVRWGVYYHTANTQDPNKKTKVVVKNCYFVSGTVCLDDAGANSNAGKSDFIITNCSFPVKYDGTDAQGVFRLNLSDEYNNVYDWNNVIRTT